MKKVAEVEHSDLVLFYEESLFTEQEIQLLIKSAELNSFERGELLLESGGSSQYVYLVMKGCLREFLQGPNCELTIAMRRAGQLCGDFSFSAELSKSAIAAEERTFVYSISKKTLRTLLVENSDFSVVLFQMLTDRYRDALSLTDRFAFASVYERVRNLLEEPNRNYFLYGSTGKLSYQRIANHIAASRDMVRKIFDQLTFGGYIHINNGQVKVLKKLPRSF